jgi:hypothetical protein
LRSIASRPVEANRIEGFPRNLQADPQLALVGVVLERQLETSRVGVIDDDDSTFGSGSIGRSQTDLRANPLFSSCEWGFPTLDFLFGLLRAVAEA